MAFQNIFTPRIYLNIPEYLASTGTVVIDPVLRTLPVSASASSSAITAIPDISAVTLTNPYVAILGHSANVIELLDANSGVISSTSIINGTLSDTVSGFSIVDVDAMPDSITFDDGSAGSILLGTYYEFSHSPDLNLTLSYEYGGIKEITTKGGSTLTNAFYTKPPAWGGNGAWELGEYWVRSNGGRPSTEVRSHDAAHAKSGRRVWSLSFSYLSDSAIFPDNAGLENETDDGNDTLLEADTLQRVIHLTNGGQIPFIFQSDGTVSPKPDQLAICKFDMNSFEFKLVANNVYNTKIKIREVW